ncbi:LamG domain-containing protein [Pelagicoccus mobilis]|uniref:Metallophosphoesterase n=1 Tax=Pelagicoccus mobilis TaxID=415221 RepID=A0A934RWV4_9BACT|nr:LamG domain-containing protein [Pelagicoccus mobilis]MBK1875862.1 metallophosphoesterase [Pelagicoccus mobilis]
MIHRILRYAVRVSLLVTGYSAAANPDTSEEWRFILLADWHWAEKYTQTERNPAGVAEAIAEDVASVRMIKQRYGGDLILMPGDSNGGHWDTPKFINANFPGATPEESILKAGKLCYEGMIDSFRKGGYSKLIMAVGDHEMGDNPWPQGSAVARCQPQFREAFANAFNRSRDGGRFLYEKPIGNAPSRPLGTKYQDTSYAYRHKNALFVTVDAFHQEDPNLRIGDEGSVTGTVVGLHLDWLESVLLEARKDEGIEHVFVQSHLPVIHPVRKVNSSGMLMDDGMDNPFWKLLRKYEVDIYFAGEVHANTVTKDPESNVIQLVSRGNFFDNIQTLDISDDKIEVTCYQHIGEKPSDGKYEVSGKLLIDKTTAETKIDGDGELALLDPSDRHFYFDFEETLLLEEHPIMGMKNRKKGDPRIIRGVRCSELIPNRGGFGSHYNAVAGNVALVDGARGLGGEFSKRSRMGVFGMGPLHGEYAASYALWIKTSSSGDMMLINTGSIWGTNLDQFFNLHLADGVPAVVVSDRQRLLGDGYKLNDGEWHHIAAVMPENGCRLSEVQLYVDGDLAKTRVVGGDLSLKFKQSVRLGFGGLNYSSSAFDNLGGSAFNGTMDEISIWTRPISREEVRSLYLK